MTYKFSLNQKVKVKVLNTSCDGIVKQRMISEKLVDNEVVAEVKYHVYVSKIQGFITNVSEDSLLKYNYKPTSVVTKLNQSELLTMKSS